MTLLLPTETLRHSLGDIAVGMRVRVKADKLQEYRRAGILNEYVEKYSGIGVVQRIVVNERHRWISIEVEFKEIQWMAFEDLEPEPEPTVTRLPVRAKTVPPGFLPSRAGLRR